jgi:hypothetical protein
MKMTLKTALALVLAVSFVGMAHVRAEGTNSESASMEKAIQDLNVEQAHLSAIKEKLTALRMQKGLLTAYDLVWVATGGYAAYGSKIVGEKTFSSDSKIKAIGGMTSKAFSYFSYGVVLVNLVNAGVDLKKVYLGDAEMQLIMSDIDVSQARIVALQEVLAKVTK